MNIDAIITILLCAFVFTMLYCICLSCKNTSKMDRLKKITYRLMRRNSVSPTIEIDIEPNNEKENEIRFSQIV
jgi:hypothetical protein